MRKKLLALILVIACFVTLAIGLTACGDKVYKITFDSQGGTSVKDYENVVESEPFTTRDGYFFRGWYTDENCNGERVEFPFEANKDTVLYAKWEKDTRTPLEKFIGAGGKYSVKLDGLDYSFSFQYNSGTQTIKVTSSYDSGLVTFFKFEFEFKIGNIANGTGSINGTDGSSYQIAINKSTSSSVTVSCTHTNGTDWTKPDIVGLKSNFINKISTAFSQFYSWCSTNYGLTVY